MQEFATDNAYGDTVLWVFKTYRCCRWSWGWWRVCWMLKWMLTCHLNVKQQAHWLHMTYNMNQSTCTWSFNTVKIISYIKTHQTALSRVSWKNWAYIALRCKGKVIKYVYMQILVIKYANILHISLYIGMQLYSLHFVRMSQLRFTIKYILFYEYTVYIQVK